MKRLFKTMRLGMNGKASTRLLPSSPASQSHVNSTASSSGVVMRAMRTRTIPISSVCQLMPSCPIRQLSSFSTLPIKITTDEIVFRRNKTQRLLDLDTLASNDWSAIEEMLLWWTRQGTKEGVDWAWKILDRLVVDLSKNTNENDMETQLRAKLLTDWLNFTINSWRLLIDSPNDDVERTSFDDCRAGIEQAR